MSEIVYKRCTKCGEMKPATLEYFCANKSTLRSECKECTRAYHRKYRDEHREQVHTYFANYHAEHREKNRADCARYRAEHQEELRANYAKWYAEHREDRRKKDAEYRKKHTEERRAQNQKWKAANKERLDAYYASHREERRATSRHWAKEHLDRVRVHSHQRRARKRNVPSTFTAKDWDQCLEYWGHCCAVCGRPQGLWHTLAQDHWIPVSKGGPYTPDNIVPLCHGDGGCNNSKYTHIPDEWLASKFSPRKARQIEQRIRDYFDYVATMGVNVE